MKKVLTLALILSFGSFTMLQAQKKIPTAIMQQEAKFKDISDSNTKLPKADATYSTEEVTNFDVTDSNTKLPMAIQGYTTEEDEVSSEVIENKNTMKTLDATYDTPSFIKNLDTDTPFFYINKMTEGDFNVFPTLPANVVHATSNVEGLIIMFVYGPAGEVKLKTRFEGSYDIDVSSYGHGTYVVRIGRGGEFYTYKFLR